LSQPHPSEEQQQQQDQEQPQQPQPQQQRLYKAFAGKGWNARTQTYTEVKVYTLEAQHVGMNSEIINYYEAHPNDPIIFTRGEDKRVATIHRESRFPAHTDHIVIPISLSMKRYAPNIPATELEILEQETRDAGDIWAGSINNTGVLSGGEIRAILSNVNEIQNLHPTIEDTQRTYASAVAAGVAITKNNDSDMFTEYYKFPEKVCNYWDCPVHNSGELKVFKHSKSLLLRESINHPWVVKKAKLDDLLRRASFVQSVTDSLMSMDRLSTLSAIDDDEFEVAEDLPLYHDHHKDDDNDKQ
jgi:hypothetical protein